MNGMPAYPLNMLNIYYPQNVLNLLPYFVYDYNVFAPRIMP